MESRLLVLRTPRKGAGRRGGVGVGRNRAMGKCLGDVPVDLLVALGRANFSLQPLPPPCTLSGASIVTTVLSSHEEEGTTVDEC